MVLYAEGFSVANFLVSSSNRQTFLAFVAQGMQQGWDMAAQTYYHYRSVEELEQAWLNYLRTNRSTPGQLAKNTNPSPNDPNQRVVVRQTAPPAQPLDSHGGPTYRGADPSPDYDYPQRPIASSSRPGYLPPYNPPNPSNGVGLGAPNGWSPVPPPSVMPGPPTVQLGPPQFGPPR